MTPDVDPHAGQPIASLGPPPGRGRGVVVLVHGRNAGPQNILDLAPRLDRPDLTYLAPAASGRSWYPHSFLSPREQNEPYLSSALGAVERAVALAAGHGVPPGRIVVAGFSQGACLASEFALRHRSRVGGLVAFSGGLIGPPGTRWDDVDAPADLHVWLGCGDVDAHVPWARVAESAAVFERIGATVDLRQYPGMGHLVSDDEIAGAQALIDRRLR